MPNVPPEFSYFAEDPEIPWVEISRLMKKYKKERTTFEAFTDIVIDLASKESMKSSPSSALICLGMEACLVRGRLAEALFMSTDSTDINTLTLRAIALFALSDIEGLGDVLRTLEGLVSESSSPSDRIRLSTIRVLYAASQRDMSVIECVTEFDALLTTYPDQVETPLIETMFALYVVGSLLKEVGQTTRALRIALTLERMAEARGHRMILALAENLRGNISNFQGNMTDAERHYLRMKELSEEVSSRLGLGMALNNLGTLRLNALRLEDALKTFEAALQHMEMDVGRQVTLANLGEIAVLLGRHKEAEQYLREALRLEEKTHKGFVESYVWYAILLTRTGRHDEASALLDKARRTAENSERPIQRGMYLYGGAVCATDRGRHKDALPLLVEALKTARNNSIFELLVRVELELARTYVGLYATTNNQEYLTGATYHLDDLLQIAKEQELHSLYAQTLLLRSQVLRLAGRYFEAVGDLERASSLAVFVGDTRLEQEITAQMASLTAAKEKPTLSLDQSHFAKSIDRAAGFKFGGQLKEVPRPTLHVLLALNRDSGMPEYVYQFEGGVNMDSTMLSGFLAAITSFSTHLMGRGGLLRSINHEGFVLLMEHTAHRTVTLIADRESFDIRYLLREFTQRYETRFPYELYGDSVTPSDFDDAEAIVHQVFFTEDATQPSSE